MVTENNREADKGLALLHTAQSVSRLGPRESVINDTAEYLGQTREEMRSFKNRNSQGDAGASITCSSCSEAGVLNSTVHTITC